MPVPWPASEFRVANAFAAIAAHAHAHAHAATHRPQRINERRSQPGYTDMHEAVSSGDPERVRELLLLRPDAVHDRTRLGESPLHIAVARAPREVVQMLCASGADPNARKNVSHRRGCTSWELAQLCCAWQRLAAPPPLRLLAR